MSKRRRVEASGHMIGSLFTFGLFGMFVLLSLLIVVIGADGYRGVVDKGEAVGEVRTSLGYVMGKLRSDAATDGIRLENRGGLDTLVLTEVYDGDVLETVIFHKDGALYEVTQYDDTVFDPESAWRLVDVAAFSVERVEDNLLKLTATTAGGRSQTVHAAIRSGQAGSAASASAPQQEVTGP